MNARQITQTIVMALLWVIVIVLFLSLMGCFGQLTKENRADQGAFSVEADCDDNTVDVRLNIDRTDEDEKAKVGQ